MLHELAVYNETQDRNRALDNYRTGADVEVDFVVETRKKTMSHRAEVVLIEVKSAKRWDERFDRHLRAEVYPLEQFVSALYAGAIV